jgi:S1-C subfamily serine protease
MSHGKKEGVLVISVQPGSPADAAGIIGTSRDPYTGAIILGDQILEVDGAKCTDPEQVSDVVESKAVGDKISLKIRRNNQSFDVVVVLKDRPGAAVGSDHPSFRKRSRL